MDDVWSTNTWEAVKRIFPDDYNGRRIILTTRLLDVATYACSSSYGPPHEMHFLDEAQSWNLLKTKVFKQEDCHTEFERIGQIIARSCRGLPLEGLLSMDLCVRKAEEEKFLVHAMNRVIFQKQKV
ncbi:UNVERIFIED_CONTAM: hypothetical protein Slati_4293100 [Sesamum latifolium]|uniref:NB-ARC domain-containing protein n=1 Tax=Sesamum latifolium TaxID=2727402 RepID=A0AAW2TDD7_9LAMI